MKARRIPNDVWQQARRLLQFKQERSQFSLDNPALKCATAPSPGPLRMPPCEYCAVQSRAPVRGARHSTRRAAANGKSPVARRAYITVAVEGFRA
jgi:hypothetical protein